MVFTVVSLFFIDSKRDKAFSVSSRVLFVSRRCHADWTSEPELCKLIGLIAAVWIPTEHGVILLIAAQGYPHGQD